jgi:hypothetical protein
VIGHEHRFQESERDQSPLPSRLRPRGRCPRPWRPRWLVPSPPQDRRRFVSAWASMAISHSAVFAAKHRSCSVRVSWKLSPVISIPAISLPRIAVRTCCQAATGPLASICWVSPKAPPRSKRTCSCSNSRGMFIERSDTFRSLMSCRAHHSPNFSPTDSHVHRAGFTASAVGRWALWEAYFSKPGSLKARPARSGGPGIRSP